MVKFVSADGRAFTDYRPNCEINRNIRNNMGLMSSFDYRMALQRNALPIISGQRKQAEIVNKLTCNCPQCKLVSNLG